MDTDKEIEREEKRTIAEIFAAQGEAYFRDKETECLRRLIKSAKNQIISVGGGLPLRAGNRELLHELGQVFYLRAEACGTCLRASERGYHQAASAGQ